MQALINRDVSAYLDGTWGGRIFWLGEKMNAGDFGSLAIKMLQASALKKPLLLVCDSYGGGTESSMAFVNLLKLLPVPVYTVVLKRAASAAVLVFASGHYRVMKQGAQLMTHASRVVDDFEHFAPGRGLEKLDRAELQRLARFSYLKFRRAMDAYAGLVLPELIFGERLIALDYTTSKALGLADLTMEHPVYDLGHIPLPAI